MYSNKMRGRRPSHCIGIYIYYNEVIIDKFINLSQACQKVQIGKTSVKIGDQNSAEFSYDSLLTITYTTSDKRITKLKCVCGEGDSLDFKGESPKLTYVRKLSEKF